MCSSGVRPGKCAGSEHWSLTFATWSCPCRKRAITAVVPESQASNRSCTMYINMRVSGREAAEEKARDGQEMIRRCVCVRDCE